MACVDIIVPTCNRAGIVPETLESVRAQTFSAWRCFIAEDGETAATREAVAPFLQDARFAYLPGRHAGTPAAARNRAVRSGDAHFVAFLDDDDLWLPEKLERQIVFMEQHPGCVLLSANAYRWNGETPKGGSLPLYHQASFSGHIPFETLATTNIIINSTAVVRRSALSQSGLFNEAAWLASFEDYELWLRIAPLGEVWVHDGPLAIYRDVTGQGIRAGLTQQMVHRKLARVYGAALRGDGTVPSPLTYAANREKANLYRNLADINRYQAGSFLGWRRLYYRFASEVRNVLLKFQQPAGQG